jgi:hypothetical protein
MCRAGAGRGGGQDGGGRRARGTSCSRRQRTKDRQPPAVAAAAAHQKAPTVRPCLCASSSGMEPYRPKGDSSRYSNTSRLYSRYGSAPAAGPGQGGEGLRAGVGGARRGRPRGLGQACGSCLGAQGRLAAVQPAGWRACAMPAAPGPTAAAAPACLPLTRGGLERQRGGALGDAVDVLRACRGEGKGQRRPASAASPACLLSSRAAAGAATAPASSSSSKQPQRRLAHRGRRGPARWPLGPWACCPCGR